MTTDPLDDLLDGSAPPTPALAGHELRAMIDASRGRARPRLRSRGVIAAVTAVVLVGGAGVATASSDWLWATASRIPRGATGSPRRPGESARSASAAWTRTTR